jgi:hypothetical protein
MNGAARVTRRHREEGVRPWGDRFPSRPQLPAPAPRAHPPHVSCVRAFTSSPFPGTIRARTRHENDTVLTWFLHGFYTVFPPSKCTTPAHTSACAAGQNIVFRDRRGLAERTHRAPLHPSVASCLCPWAHGPEHHFSALQICKTNPTAWSALYAFLAPPLRKPSNNRYFRALRPASETRAFHPRSSAVPSPQFAKRTQPLHVPPIRAASVPPCLRVSVVFSPHASAKRTQSAIRNRPYRTSTSSFSIRVPRNSFTPVRTRVFGVISTPLNRYVFTVVRPPPRLVTRRSCRACPGKIANAV